MVAFGDAESGDILDQVVRYDIAATLRHRDGALKRI